MNLEKPTVKQFQLHPVVRTNFLLISIGIVSILVLFSLITTKTIPAQLFGFLLLIVPIVLSQTNHVALVSNESLTIGPSILIPEIGKWQLTELNLEKIELMHHLDVRVPKQAPVHFFAPNTGKQFGTVKLRDKTTAFHFISKEDVPLVFIPTKKGSHILLTLKQPEEFIATLKEACANS